MDKNLDNNKDEELNEVCEGLEEKAKEKKKKPMKMHSASLRKIGEIQRKRILRPLRQTQGRPEAIEGRQAQDKQENE